MKSLTLRVAFLLSVTASLLGHAQDVIDVKVAPSGYNRFVFTEPYKRILTPPETHLDKEPVAVANNRAFLLDLSGKFPKGLFVVVELESGNTVQFNLQQDSAQSLPITWRQEGASESGKDAETEIDERPTTEWVVKSIWQRVAANKIPEGFAIAKRKQNPIEVREAGKDTVVLNGRPLGVWEGPGMRLYGYELTSERPVPVAEHDFYGPGVISVFLEADSVGPTLSPRVYILREMGHG